MSENLLNSVTVTTEMALGRLANVLEPQQDSTFVSPKGMLADKAIELAHNLEASPSRVSQSYLSGALSVRGYAVPLAAAEFMTSDAFKDVYSRIAAVAPDSDTQSVLLFTAGIKVALQAKRHLIR